MVSSSSLGILNNFLICLLVSALLIPPFIVTVINIVRLIMNMYAKDIRWKKIGWIENYTVIGGGILSGVLYALMAYKDYTMPIVLGGNISSFHEPLYHQNMLTIVVLAVIGIVCYMVLKSKKKLPPLSLAAVICGIYIGLILSVLWIVQLSKNSIFDADTDFYAVVLFMLYPVNYIILSIIAIKNAVQNSKPYNGDNKLFMFLSRIISKASLSLPWAFILLFPVLGIVISILSIFGQHPNSIITAFTSTSDWTFSQQISPPPVTTGHYLCTVAATGHSKIVRPLRYGNRHGHRIVVNRQLMIANAFEELIAQRAPKAHSCIRKFYDEKGYPISKHITNQYRADAVYLLMKPLEWFFLITLYLFDICPEDRIAVQYPSQAA